MTFASRSLPVPLSPVRRTVEAGLVATLATSWRSAAIDGEAPTILCRLYGRAALVRVLSDLTPQPRRFECPFHGRDHFVQIERLVREVERPQFHRFDRGLDAGVGGEQDHQDVLIELLDLA